MAAEEKSQETMEPNVSGFEKPSRDTATRRGEITSAVHSEWEIHR